MKHIRGRIEDYVQFGHELLGYLDQQAKTHPELRERIAELRSVARKIDAHVDGRKADIKTPQYVIDLTEKFRRTVMDYEGDDALTSAMPSRTPLSMWEAIKMSWRASAAWW